MIRTFDEIQQRAAETAGELLVIAVCCAMFVFAVWWRGHEESKHRKR